MNIIILSTTKQSNGGVERFSSYLHNCLKKNGHTVTILAKEDVSGPQRAILRLKKLVGMEQPALGYFLGRKASRLGFDICVTNGMLGWNLKNKKVINVQHGTFARAAIRIDKSTNIFKFLIKRYIWGYFEGLAARRASVCVAVSKETKESVEAYYQAQNVIVIQNAIDTEFFKPQDKNLCREAFGLPRDKYILVFVGRFEYAKGKNILEAIQDKASTLNVKLIIAEKYSQEQLALLYGAADIFLLPSLHEGCSYALLDAMSTGLPFLASPVGLVPELMADHLFPLCIVSKQTPESYIEKIQILFSLPTEERSMLGENIRAYILSKHSISEFSRQYEQIIQRIV